MVLAFDLAANSKNWIETSETVAEQERRTMTSFGIRSVYRKLKGKFLSKLLIQPVS